MLSGALNNVRKPKAADAADRTAVATDSLANATHALVVATQQLASFTGGLIVVGVISTVVLFGQLMMFRRQLQLMKVGTDDAKALAKAAKISADETRQSVNLAREEFIASHRANIYVLH